jgi:hypothetical protein
VTELVFNADLYSGFAVDEAVKAYSGHATMELEERPDAYVVRVTSKGDFDEATIADELGNYALGATIEARAEGS